MIAVSSIHAIGRLSRLGTLLAVAAILAFGTACQSPESAKYADQGKAHLVAREYDLAIEDFDKAIELDPESSEAYVGRGVAHSAKGRV